MAFEMLHAAGIVTQPATISPTTEDYMYDLSGEEALYEPFYETNR
jgi:hypothetical protein